MGLPVPISQLSLNQRMAVPATLPGLGLPLSSAPDANARRERIWELSPSFHCSIIGTCLTTSALRQLFAKLGQPDAKTASDHDLHSRAVRIAGQRDVAGKMLNRMLEKRHEAHVKRFAKAKTTTEVKALWQEALERGDIPGAYWAVLTHMATDQALVSEVFGEVHMLSHLVGMSNRVDIVRLRALERDLGERDEKIAQQQARIARMAQERDTLSQRIEVLACEVKRRPIEARTDAPGEIAANTLRQRLADEQARSTQLALRLAEQEETLAARDQEIQALQNRNTALSRELLSLEATLADLASAGEDAPPAATDLAGKRLLYVGGRPKQIEQLRALAARRGGMLLAHDGGIEDSMTLLPGLVSQADAALFPVDCVSHQAAGQVKRLCREMGKIFMPLRSASAASFLLAVAELIPLAELGDAV
jgi:hypothetical protein